MTKLQIMKLTETSSRICWIIIYLVNISVLAVSASSPLISSTPDNPQDIVQEILNKKNHNGSDNSANSPLESMWKMFKEILESTTKNALPSYSTSSSSDSSKPHDQMIRSQQQIHENILNRRGLLMEQSLNEHYTHQFFDFFPQLKEYSTMENFFPKNEVPTGKSRNQDSMPDKTLRWQQLDSLTRDTMCYCITEDIDSYWSFQWCPQKEIIFQGRRDKKGSFQPIHSLGTGFSLPDDITAASGETIDDSTREALYIMTDAKKKYPSAVAIHPYVNGDACEGGPRQRMSAVVFHDNTSAKCKKKEGREMNIDSVVEVRICQYMLHVCTDQSNESKLTKDRIDSFDSDSDDDKEVQPLLSQHETPLVTESTAKEINQTLHYIKNHITESFVRKSRADAQGKSRESVLKSLHSALPPLPETRIEENLKLVKDMFRHAYDSYMYHGFPASEVKPISCAPASFSLVKIPGLTLIDSLDTLVILGNYTEFARAVERLRFLNDNLYEATGISTTGGGLFDINYNVSVFETNIRVLGGLLSAHQLAAAFLQGEVLKNEVWADDKSILMGVLKNGQDQCNEEEDISSASSSNCDSTSTILQCKQESPQNLVCHNQTDSHWVYDGFLLDLARDIGDRLLPAFNTATGIPYGTVNLLSGIPHGETPIASLAGGGTLSLEMELLSRLTGNSEYGRAAKLAARALWMRRSSLSILGKHICTKKGQWTETLSGIGSNSDSFYEYLIKHHILFPEDSDYWLQLVAAYGGVYNESRVGEWYGDVDMMRGKVQNGAPRRVLEALMAFYPGMQVLLGEITPAARTLNSFFLVREYLGFLPERFDFGSWKVDYGGGTHLLRPELLESAYFLHRSSKGFQNQFRSRHDNYTIADSSGWVWSGDFALHAIEKLTRTECGYASPRNVSPETSGKLKAEKNQITLSDEMPSYFLSETLKYLYLLFDDKNILHVDNDREWVFTTEAHPIHHEPKEMSIDANLIKQTEKLKLRLQRRRDKRNKPENDVRQQLVNEKWTESSKMEVFVKQLEPLIERNGMTYKNRREYEQYVSHGDNTFGDAIERLFPNDNAWSPFDVFNERLQTLNPTFLSFRKLGSRLNITNSCPNLYASDYLWVRALNGGVADYSDTYKSSTSDDYLVSESDIIHLGSFDALALHGAGVHIKSLYNAFYRHPIRESKTSQDKTPSHTLKNGEKKGDLGNGSTRFEMGDGMGSFDISAFPGGSGFFVQHVESGETIVVTLIDEDKSSNSKGPMVLVYSNSGEGSKAVGVSQDDGAINKNLRTVVLADLDGNSYSCEVRIFESSIRSEKVSTCAVETSQENVFDTQNDDFEAIEEKLIHRFPCSPALFGPTHISHLGKVNSIEVEAKIQPSGVDDKYGCGDLFKNSVSKGSDKEPEMSDSSYSEKAGSDQDSSEEVVSLVQRGFCTFQEKSFMKKLRENAKGVIVMNSDEGDDLFVMSGGGSERLADLDPQEYPVTVLVTWDDGQKILQTIDAHSNISDRQIKTRISLVRDDSTFDAEDTEETKTKIKFWPRVKANREALQIYSPSGWGIHAVQTYVDAETSDVEKAQLSWQLYLLKHDMVG